MIATILSENKLDPSFVIGTGNVPSLGSSGHFGKGKYFVSEADEYASEPIFDKTPKFLWQNPEIAVITNIEYDHPDFYASLDDVSEAFEKFIKNIQPDGTLIACIDNLEVKKILKNYKKRIITYGFSKNADFCLARVSISQDRMFFWVNAKDTLLGEFGLNVVGEHNALNATAAIAVCMEIGLSTTNIRKGLLSFKGLSRRFEFIGKLSTGALVYDDYAHHPTEIKTTLDSIKKAYPMKKIVCIFQPHTYSRTNKLFEQFIKSFISADTVILSDIFPSFREAKDLNISSKNLADRISLVHKNTIYIPSLLDVVKYVDQKGYGSDYLIVTMGAGDINKVANELIK
jgi:UDP-N-acetylmuramate--alanine ligase